MKEPIILWITERGQEIAQKIETSLGGKSFRYQNPWVKKAFFEKRPLIFVGACGIAVRAVAPYLKHKSEDPAVVVVDETGRFAISLLSGHLGGANALTQRVAEVLSAIPVITTASDLRGLPALDLWLRENRVVIKDFSCLKALQAKLLREGKIKVYLEPPLKLSFPPGLEESPLAEADLLLSYRKREGALPVRALCLGVGFHAGEDDLPAKVGKILDQNGLSLEAVFRVATVKRKGRERALKALAASFSAEVLLFEEEELKKTSPPSPSRAKEFLRLPGVAEPSALLAAEGGPLLLPKQTLGGVTLAVALHGSLAG